MIASLSITWFVLSMLCIWGVSTHHIMRQHVEAWFYIALWAIVSAVVVANLVAFR